MPSIILPPGALDMLTRWEPALPKQAGFYAGLDNETKTVRVMGSGVWHEADADRYFAEQSRIVAEARRRFGSLKVFFDVREWVVENPQSALQFQGMNGEIYRPDDRLAAVVSSSDYKRHPRTALSAGNNQSFISLKAAEMWLQAYAIPTE